MGLLNFFSQDMTTPEDQGNIAMAMSLLAAGAPSRTPVSLAQAIAAGMQAGQSASASAIDRKKQADMLKSRIPSYLNGPSLQPQINTMRQIQPGFGINDNARINFNLASPSYVDPTNTSPSLSGPEQDELTRQLFQNSDGVTKFGFR